MWITDIRIDGFGVWNTISVDELSPGITLFYGPNEAGKTTLMQFMRAIFYGFSPERRKLYLPPVYGGTPGGMVRAENHNGGFVIERRESEKDSHSEGRVVVLSDNGSRQGQHLLNVLVSGIDESIFNNVFAIGIRELQELATLNDTQAAEQLYNMASGVDRVSLVEVMRQLEAAQTAIWNSEQPARLQKLLDRRFQLGSEVGDLERQIENWADLTQQRKSLIAELSQLEQRIATTKFELRSAEIAVHVREPWENRAEVEAQLADLGELEDLPERCLQRLGQINTKSAELREELAPHKARRHEIRKALAAQPINRALWDHSCRIEAICEHGPWIAALDNEIKQLSQAVESGEEALLAHEESLSGDRSISVSAAPSVTPAVMRQIRPAAQSLRDATRKRAIARKVQRKTRQDVDEVTADLAHELDGKPVEHFEELFERTSHLVKSLRRRIELDERLETARRAQRELDQEYDEVLDDQIQNIRILAGIGGMFVFGFVLAMTGIFGWKIMPMTAELCWGVTILGVICIALSVAWKVVLERTAQDELDECIDRREELENKIDAAASERNELDGEIPSGAGSLASRLADAERQLRELEENQPLQQEREQAEKRKYRSRRHASGADEELRDARRRWRRSLREVGLPETLTPKHIRQLGSHHKQKTKLDGLLKEKRERLENLTADRQSLVERLNTLTSDVGFHATGTDPQIQLSQLETALSGQREMAQTRRQLRSEEKELRREFSVRVKQLRQLARTRDSLFAEARVADEEELRDREAAIALRDDLQEQQAALSERITAIIGEHCEQTAIGDVLENHSPVQLERRARTLASSLQSDQSHLAQAHQRHGEIKQEMKAIAENKRLAAAKFELACVETRIENEVVKWRTLAGTLRLLEDIRETYEVERQPETLGEASLYLERMTAGKYTRIWTPLGKNELRIDDQEGKPLPLEVLSRGTREVVFLSLRLALVAAYGRRGVSVPMVLDDVLVNLDVARAEAAVEVLCDFAREGRQLLFFTCHEHVKAMFVAAGIDTRILPSQQSPGVHVVPLLERQAPVAEQVEPQREPVAEVEQAIELDDQAAAEEPSSEEETTTAEAPAETIRELEAAIVALEDSAAAEEEPTAEPEADSSDETDAEEPGAEIDAAAEEEEEDEDDDGNEENADEVEADLEVEADEEFELAGPAGEQSDPTPFEPEDFWWWESRSSTLPRRSQSSLTSS